MYHEISEKLRKLRYTREDKRNTYHINLQTNAHKSSVPYSSDRRIYFFKATISDPNLFKNLASNENILTMTASTFTMAVRLLRSVGYNKRHRKKRAAIPGN